MRDRWRGAALPRGLAALIALLSCRAVAAEPSPWVPIGDDVRVIADPRVEAELRRDLIQRATRTVDLVSYDLRPDEEVALPLATALRDAADRGVRVRVLLSWSAQSLFDREHRFGRQLIDPPTRVPIEYVIVGGPTLEDHGFGILDSIHEKLLIVDGRALLATGRGVGEDYFYWLDTAFAVRGGLVAETARAAEALWAAVRAHQAPFQGNIDWHERPRAKAPRYEPGASSALSREQRRGVDGLLEFLLAPKPTAAPAVGRARVLHHDLLRQLHALSPTPVELGVDERTRRLVDPVVDALVARLATARSVRIALISTILHPSLRKALIDAARRGARVTLFINTCAPRLDRSRKPIVSGGVVWATELPDLDDLIAAGARTFQFQVDPRTPWTFLHRKLAVVDDAVFFGSHNLNLPSTVSVDELSFEVESPSLAAELARRFDDDLALSGRPIDPKFVHAERGRLGHTLLRWMSRAYFGYM